MPVEEQGNPAGIRPTSPTSAVRIVPARARAANRPEFRRDGDWIEVTVSVPDVTEPRFRYAVGRRYLLVWSKDDPHANEHFVLLPQEVDPQGHKVTFVNGVVDARLRLRR